MSIILASASPRRRELMQMLGVSDLKVIPAVGEEKAGPGLPPEELVKALAAHKATHDALDVLHVKAVGEVHALGSPIT